jgi:hypothetical protein
MLKLDPKTERQIASAVESLAEQYGNTVEVPEVKDIAASELDSMLATARIGDFIPTLLYRQVRLRLDELVVTAA